MKCLICEERAKGKKEVARFGPIYWDITKAKQIAKERQNIIELPPEQVREEALSPAPREGYSVIGGFETVIDEDHLSHIPDPTEPVIVACLPPYPGGDQGDLPIVIDGHHRMVLAAREGRGVSAYFLSLDESRRCILPKLKLVAAIDRPR
jgi:hypothetical protein